MTTYGYARVSTDGQTLDAQREALAAAGAEKMFAETASGARSDRAQLARMMKALASGDTLLVTRLDRLARSTRDLLNILAALEHGAHVVVGTSGLGDEDYARIDAVARERGRGVLACGNFALTAVLLIKFSEMAAKILPQWEIIDYAYAGKPDAPSGTVRELATRMGKVRQPQLEVPLAETRGLRETRGGTLAGSQVHAVRLPGFVLGAETIFGLPDQTLSIRHNAGASAKPYVDGALLAIRKVSGLVGLHRGLDAVLEL